MNTYECTILVDGPKQLEEFKTFISENGATISDEKPWGKRLLTYPIDKKEAAEFHTMQLSVDSSKLADVRKKLQYANIVIRSLIIDNDNL